MVELRGFKGFVFDADKTGALDAVLTPPYDVIGPEEREQMAASSACNMTHLTLPKAENELSPYANAAAILQSWIAQGALRQDEEPAVYLLRQRYAAPDGTGMEERRAFFAVMRLPEEDEHFILGHERTFDGPIEDRLALMESTCANIEPIFVMYSDPGLNRARDLFEPMNTQAPLIAAETSDGVQQEVWRAPFPEALGAQFQGQTLYIADGHHRFKTACMYRDKLRDADPDKAVDKGHNYIMAGFVAFEEPGLKIFAAHRIVPKPFEISFDALRSKLAPYFSLQQLAPEACHAGTLAGQGGGCRFVVCTADAGGWLLTLDESQRQALLATSRDPAWCNLDVAVLHRGILDRLLDIPDPRILLYEKDDSAAASLVGAGKASLAFLLRPTRPEQVRACAEAHEPMPQKSTYYFPKLPSGAVLHIFG